MNILHIKDAVLVVSTLAVIGGGLSSCGLAGGEDPGKEFMPDMFHSTAYEANLYDYYYYNTWGTEKDYRFYANPRKPVKGTIPRGYAGLNKDRNFGDMEAYLQSMPVNGYVPYYYDDTEEERTRAIAEITSNPYPITSDGLARGKELYDVYCGICHGDIGDGAGHIARDDSPYPAVPANMQQPEFVSASEGRYYHAIMYGKNVMGGYSDKLSYEERWQVIHYIRSLQAKEAGLEYSEEKNTLNNSVPGANASVYIQMDDEDTSDNTEGVEDHGMDEQHH